MKLRPKIASKSSRAARHVEKNFHVLVANTSDLKYTFLVEERLETKGTPMLIDVLKTAFRAVTSGPKMFERW